MSKAKIDCMKAALVAMAKAESQKYSDILDHQTRIISLLVTEAQQRAQNLMDLVGKLNRLADNVHADQLTLFRHLDNSADEMFTFTQKASKFYPDSTKFLLGNCHSTEAFNMICEGVFGYNDKGEEVADRRVILCTAQEAEEFGKWLEKHKKIADHMRRNDAGAMFEDDKPVSMGGWNSQPIVCYNDNGEWRKFDSVTAARKATGYSDAKLRKALKNGTEYQGFKWVTLEDYEHLQHAHEFGRGLFAEEGKA